MKTVLDRNFILKILDETCPMSTLPLEILNGNCLRRELPIEKFVEIVLGGSFFLKILDENCSTQELAIVFLDRNCLRRKLHIEF